MFNFNKKHKVLLSAGAIITASILIGVALLVVPLFTAKDNLKKNFNSLYDGNGFNNLTLISATPCKFNFIDPEFVFVVQDTRDKQVSLYLVKSKRDNYFSNNFNLNRLAYSDGSLPFDKETKLDEISKLIQFKSCEDIKKIPDTRKDVVYNPPLTPQQIQSDQEQQKRDDEAKKNDELFNSLSSSEKKQQCEASKTFINNQLDKLNKGETVIINGNTLNSNDKDLYERVLKSLNCEQYK